MLRVEGDESGVRLGGDVPISDIAADRDIAATKLADNSAAICLRTIQ